MLSLGRATGLGEGLAKAADLEQASEDGVAGFRESAASHRRCNARLGARLQFTRYLVILSQM